MRRLFKLVGEVTLEGMSAVNKGLTSIDKEAKKAERTIAKFGKNMSSAGSDLTKFVTGPIAAVGAAVIKFGADFDHAMTKSLAIMGDMSEEMRGKMSDAAREVALTSTFSAKQAAEAYYFLASAGLSAAQSIKALPVLAKFAEAGTFNLARATELLADAQSALGLKSEDASENMLNMGRVSDVLVKANALANASVEQFATSLTTKAAAALRILGKDMEEGVAVLSAFADQGVKGEEAGTQFAMVLRDLQKASIKNAEGFTSAGVAVYDASGEMRNIADIIADLENRLSGMSDEQKRAELTTLGFTDRSLHAITALVGFSDNIRKFETNLRAAGGTTEDVAEKQLKSFTNQIILLKNKLVDVGLTLWETIGPTLIDTVVPALDGLIQKIKGLADWFSDLPQPAKDTIIQLTAMLAVAGPLLLGLGQLITITKSLSAAVLLMNGALLANPFILAAAALAVLTAGFIAASKASNDFNKNLGKNVAEKQAKATRESIEELIPLYNELALTDRQVIGGERFKEVSDRIKELEINLGDAGIAFEGGFSSKAQAAENYLTDLAISGVAASAAIVDLTEKTNYQTEEEKRAAKERADAAKKLADEKTAFEQQWTDNLNKLIDDRATALEREYNDAIAQAQAKGADTTDIEIYYQTERNRMLIENADIENEAREKERQAFLESEENKRAEVRKTAEEAKQKNQEVANQIVGMFQAAQQTIFGFLAANSETDEASLEAKYQRDKAYIENNVKDETERSKQLEALEIAIEKKKTDLLRRRAAQEKAGALFAAVINVAQGITKAIAQGGIAGAIFGAIVGALGAIQVATIASRPLPMARGGMVKGGQGGIVAEVGEGREDEIVFPLKTGIQALADALLEKLRSIELPTLSMPQPSFAMAGGASSDGAGNHYHFHIGTLIADDSGIKEFERRAKNIRIAESQRRGAD